VQRSFFPRREDVTVQTENSDLRDLLDRSACADVLTRYCRALDWLDEDLLATVFTPEAEVDYGFFKGTGAEFMPFVMGVERTFVRRWHFGAPPLVSVIGDTAEAESNCMACAVSEADGQTTTNLFGGRYLDTLARGADGWRITRRVFVLDWQHSLVAEGGVEALPGLTWSTRMDCTSPLYRSF
jgi:SnoaL-like domain